MCEPLRNTRRGASEVPLGQQAIMRAAQQSKIFECGQPPERVSLLVVQLQESTTLAAPALAIDVSALEVVAYCDRASDLVRDVLTAG